jgi:hypothetical protein
MSKENTIPLEKIFGSRSRAKLLVLFFDNPDKQFFVREIARLIDEQINSVRRELLNLDSLGLVKSETFENKVYYSANAKHPFFRPLVEICSKKEIATKSGEKVRASGWEEYTRPVKNLLKSLVVTNRLPGQEGLDMLVIGHDKDRKLTRWAEVMEKKMGKPLNYAILTPDDFIYRWRVRDRFVVGVFELEITEVIDPDKLITEAKNV